jgi:hypothetical protein
MKHLAMILLACVIVISCSRKNYFTGIIESDVHLIPLVDTLNMNDFIATNGTKVTGIYNNGNFIYRMNAQNVEIYFFDVETGKYYLKTKNANELSYWDKDYSFSKVKDIKLKPKDTTILGYLCDKIEYDEIYTNSSLKVHHLAYYNQSDFSINPGWYKDMKLGGYNEIMRITRAIPLLDIAEYPWIRFEYAATKVVRDTTVDIISLIKKYENSFPQKRTY